ncbi:RusA family crossover junction endodeoxyribonuclease [Burkholderia multivorans]|nr:RusA family crossover junction endodeoxyribonuclease [Burkholderia multivorans]
MTHDQPITAPVIARRVAFVVPGKPIAKGRPRFVRRGPHVRTYTPEPTERYENLVKIAARAAMRDDEPYAGPVRLIVDIGVPIPASWSEKRQRAAAAGAIGATKKPDAGEQWRGFAQIRVAKFRHGRTGDVPMTYCGEFVRFESHSGAWPTHTVQKQSRSRGFE